MKEVFITGATGYIGKRLTKQLLERGYRVVALVRKGSEHKVDKGAEIIIADPFDPESFQSSIPKNAVFVQLLGVPHPSPKKAKQFREIDWQSVKASADAAAVAGVSHFVYVSVAMQPSKLMAAYKAVRQEGEIYCKSKNLSCTFIRPWYVLGPGHYWPILLLPLYGIAELVPSWRQKARDMALVTLGQVLRTLVTVVEVEPLPLRILEIKQIRDSH
ncbi:MAG: NAD(P)H-binding protein [Chitinophagaceae bacterium]